MKTKKPSSVVVLISGYGSNLQALIDGSANSQYSIAAVISNKADAYGLERARKHQIPAIVVDHQEFSDRESFDHALRLQIEKYQPQLVVLAGFMRILSAAFVSEYKGRLLNIHPSLLPNYPGTNTHQRVLDAKDKEHGASVHFVTEELDSGPVIAQIKVQVDNENAEALAAKVARQEHVLYPTVVNWFAQGRLRMENELALLDEKPLPGNGFLLDTRP